MAKAATKPQDRWPKEWARPLYGPEAEDMAVFGRVGERSKDRYESS